MCLTVSIYRFKLLESIQDVTVYKVVDRVYNIDSIRCLRNKVKSQIFDFVYVKGVKQETIDIVWSGKLYLDNININRGYHFYININNDYNKLSHCIGEFIIPKGTRYYMDKECNLGVAESIIFNRIVSNKEILSYRDKL